MLNKGENGKYTYGESLDIHSCVCRVAERQWLPTTAHPDTRILALENHQDSPQTNRKGKLTLSRRFNIPGLTSR